jgi:ribosomal protein L37AE/L43A
MGVRAGQGYGVPKLKRLRCPDCGKKGVTQWKVTPFGLIRDCQYCGGSWTELSWKIAKGAKMATAGGVGLARGGQQK